MIGIILELIVVAIVAVIFVFTNPHIVDSVLMGILVPLVVYGYFPSLHPVFLILIGIGSFIGMLLLMQTLVGMVLSAVFWLIMIVPVLNAGINDKIWRIFAIVIAVLIVVGCHVGAYFRNIDHMPEITKENVIISIIVLAAIVVVCPLIIHIVANVQKDKGTKGQTALYDNTMDDARQEQLENSPSDIEGMTKYDKVKAGLSSEDGSDTDGDGLTDKEEIETYKSDPLKKSTAGDMYTDGYKVANGMDLQKTYDYSGDPLEYPNNHCSNVSLTGKTADDLNAVVADVTGMYEAMASPKTSAYEWANTYVTYKDYEVSGFSGILSIDLSDALTKNNISLDDIQVLLSADITYNKIKKTSFEKEGNVITPDLSDVEGTASYLIVIADKKKKNVLNSTLSELSSLLTVSAELPTFQSGDVLVSAWGLPVIFGKAKPEIYYQSSGDAAADEKMLQIAIRAADYYYGFPDDQMPTVADAKQLNTLEFETRKSALTGILKIFEVKPYAENENWLSIIYGFFIGDDIDLSQDEVLAAEAEEAEKQQKLAQRAAFKDSGILPFSNFGSYISEGGNCAGIAHLTALLNNTGSIPAVGSYDFTKFPFTKGDSDYSGLGSVSWDLSGDEANTTLMNPGLKDYKDADFVKNHGSNAVIDNNTLSAGEQQFVNMVGDYWAEANTADVRDQVINNYYFDGKTECLTYKTVRQMMEAIDNGKVLECALDLYDVKEVIKNSACTQSAFIGGHSINLYDYKQTFIDSGNGTGTYMTYFKVYDSNCPNDTETNDLVMVTFGQDDADYVWCFKYYPLKLGYVALGKQIASADRETKFCVTDEAYTPLCEVYRLPEGFVARP